MEWVKNCLWSQPKAPPEADASLKRKRSPAPQLNSFLNPIFVDGNNEEDEIVPDSEDERQETVARTASALKRPRLQSAGSDTKDGRRQLNFEGKSQGPPMGLFTRSACAADDEDELDTILPDHSSDQPSQPSVNRQAPPDWETQNQAFQASFDRLQRTLKSKEDELCLLKSDLDRKRKRIAEGEERSQRLERQVNELTQREQRVRGQSDVLARRCEGAEDMLEKTKSLLKTRTEELTIAQAFMTTADQFSVADLARLVDELNDDIYQAAMNLSDMVLVQKPPADAANPGEATEVDEARKSVVNRYGEELTVRLVSDLAQKDADTILFESLIQNVFATRCTGLIQSICPGNVNLDKVLKGIWDRLSVTRETAIAKNWLAMTSSQLKPEAIESESTLELLLCLLTVGGWRMGASSENKLHETALDKLSQIQEKALRVREMAMEGILSAEVEAFRAPTKRNYNPSCMQDAYDSQHPPPDDTVVCQTGLGLRYIKRIPTSSSSGSAQTLRKSEVIMKAKVLLSSTLAS